MQILRIYAGKACLFFLHEKSIITVTTQACLCEAVLSPTLAPAVTHLRRNAVQVSNLLNRAGDCHVARACSSQRHFLGRL